MWYFTEETKPNFYKKNRERLNLKKSCLNLEIFLKKNCVFSKWCVPLLFAWLHNSSVIRPVPPPPLQVPLQFLRDLLIPTIIVNKIPPPLFNRIWAATTMTNACIIPMKRAISRLHLMSPCLCWMCPWTNMFGVISRNGKIMWPR